MTTCNYMNVQLDGSGRMRFQNGYHNGRPNNMDKAVAFCAWGPN